MTEHFTLRVMPGGGFAFCCNKHSMPGDREVPEVFQVECEVDFLVMRGYVDRPKKRPVVRKELFASIRCPVCGYSERRVMRGATFSRGVV
jgi:hypothetical protein